MRSFFISKSKCAEKPSVYSLSPGLWQGFNEEPFNLPEPTPASSAQLQHDRRH
jgi:hypothetical protein